MSLFPSLSRHPWPSVGCLLAAFALPAVGAEPTGPLSPRADIALTTSYHQQSTVPFYRNLPITPTITDEKTPGYLAWATADFDRDGDVDLLAVRVDWTAEGEPVEYYENQKDTWVAKPDVFGDRPPVVVHGRKAIVADFDANGWPDVLIAAHGHDVAPPFKGEKLQVLFNNQGRFTARELPLPGGFYHSACAGDIDHDGDIDLFVTDALNGRHKICKFLRNDGAGNFTHAPELFPTALQAKYYFTSELHDIDADGYLDLVVAGHEMDGSETRILWGGATGRYTVEHSTQLPTVHGYRIVIDIDFLPRAEGGFDVVLNRTGDNKGPMRWYRGFYLQLLAPVAPRVFEDFSIARLRDHFARTGPWITWLRVHDINGDGRLDLTSANKLNQQEWLATASGVLRRAEP